MDLQWSDFFYLVFGIIMLKVSFLMVFHNLFFVFSDTSDKNNRDHRAGFGVLAGKILGGAGFLTILQIVARRFFIETHFMIYIGLLMAAVAYLLVQYHIGHQQKEEETRYNEK